MEDQSPRRRPPLGVLIALGVVVLSAGSAAAWFTWTSISPQKPTADRSGLEIDGETFPEESDPPASNRVSVPDPPPADVAIAPGQRQETIYWLANQGTAVALAPAEISLPQGQPPGETLTVAFTQLMQGPAADLDTAATSIPPKTELLALAVKSNGVHVNLSDTFTQGGGSASMIGRLAQVVYTATTLEPDAPVWISVAGEPLTLLGGEGLLVRHPVTRGDLKTDFGVDGLTD